MTTQDDSGTHATLADSGDNSDSQDLPRGSNLGRYVIIEPIGSGGMGTVYRAYDPQLNRGVALKILSIKHADLQESERAKARLIREAQALAQLSHPNVVAVHDAGTFEDDVFIAMELVEGKTLGDWLKEKKRAVKEILEVMIAAGRGLSAAHKAGLVHRDFKPGNVMVGDDGRVRVLDFGLARAADQQESVEDEQLVSEQEGQSCESNEPFDYKEISSDSSPNLLQSPLTHAGGVLGTPMYMAPEQHLGLKTDERTDQFGFCVVLYEALYRKRPFLAATMEKLKREVIRKQVRPPSTDTDVPAWLWRIIYKGLSVKPEDRYATIDSLLEDLDKDPEEERRQKRLVLRRRLTVAALILLTITVPIGVWYGMRYRTYQLCKAAEGVFDGVWDHATKNAVKKTFLDTGKTYALDTWVRVERILDRYLTEWALMRSDVCEARLIRGTQSEDLFDLRMSCLRKRQRELGALMKVFVGADSGVVQKAVQASSSLTGIATCADEEAIRAPYPPPKTEADRRKVAAIRESLADVEALEKTGKYREGLELVKKLCENANALAYRPVQGEAMYRLGTILERTGEYTKAETTLRNAINAAGESKDVLLAAEAMSWLVRIVGYQQARHEAGLIIAQDAKLLIDIADGDDQIRATLSNFLGVLYWSKGDNDKALNHFRKSLAKREKNKGNHEDGVAALLNNIAGVHMRKGEYHRALEYYNRALAIWEETLGPDHPQVTSALNNLGLVFNNQGDFEKAKKYHHRALAIREKSLGRDHPRVAMSLNNLGGVYSNRGEYAEALECFRKSLAIREKALGRDHPSVVWSLTGISGVFVEQGQIQKALESLERVVSVCEKKNCPPDPHGQALYRLGRALVDTGGDKKRAIKLTKRAQEIFEMTPKRFNKELKEVDTWLQKYGAGKLAKKANK